MNPISNIIAYHGLLRLKNWTDSSKSARKVYFTIPGKGAHPFNKFTARDGKIAGQRFTVALNLLDESGTLAWNGDMMLLGWNVSGLAGRTITMLIDDHGEDHPFANYSIGTEGQTFAAAFVELAPDETPIHQDETLTSGEDEHLINRKSVTKFVAKKPLDKKPFGDYAKELHRSSWFVNQEVLRSVGCEDDFHAWICNQPCLFSAINEHHVNTAEVDFMKVNGPQEYAAIPVCSNCHPWNIVPIKTRNQYVKKWAEEKIALRLKVESLGFASPDQVVDYAKIHNIMHTLPMAYRQYKNVLGQYI